MERMKQDKSKTLNYLGLAYADAKVSTQLRLKAALLEHSERDLVDYWRAFRDVWRYSSNIGKAPFILVKTVENILNIKIEWTNEKV